MHRNQTLDIAKALAIVSVIMGHAIQFGSGEAYLDGELYLNNPVFKFIYSFHMPLFMLISGYLFAFSIEKDTKKNIFKQRIKSLVIPIFIWALIPTTQKLCKMNDVSLIDLPIKYVGTILFYLWFLWSLFYNSVILIALNGVGKNKQIISYGVIFVIMFFIPDSFNLALYKFMLPYFLLGFYFNKLHLVSIIT